MLAKRDLRTATTFTVTTRSARQLAAVAKGCAKDRPVLELIEVTYEPGQILAAATDGYMILTRTTETDGEQEGTFLVDGKAWATALTIAAKASKDPIQITVGDQLTITNGVQSTIPFSGQNYPDWRKILDFDTEKTPIGLNASYVVRIVQGQSTLASDYKHVPILLTAAPELQPVGWATKDGYLAALMPIKIT